MRLRFSALSRRDLDDIGSYVAQDSPGAAVRLIDRLTVACSSLTTSPRRYPVVSRRGKIDIRRMTVGSYSVLYAVADDILVVRVLHGARDVSRATFPNDQT